MATSTSGLCSSSLWASTSLVLWVSQSSSVVSSHGSQCIWHLPASSVGDGKTFKFATDMLIESTWCTPSYELSLKQVSFSIWNLFHTPSPGPTYRVVHIWVGRIALLANTVGMTAGFVRSWYEGYKEEDKFRLVFLINDLQIGISEHLCLISDMWASQLVALQASCSSSLGCSS